MKTSVLLLTIATPLTLPAVDVTGIWKSEFDSQIGRQKYTFTFKQDGTNLTGKASSEIGDQRRETDLTKGEVAGDRISFVETLNFQGNDIRITYAGKISDHEIMFTREVGDFAKEDIVARRGAAAPEPAGPTGARRGGLPIVLVPTTGRSRPRLKVLTGRVTTFRTARSKPLPVPFDHGRRQNARRWFIRPPAIPPPWVSGSGLAARDWWRRRRNGTGTVTSGSHSGQPDCRQEGGANDCGHAQRPRAEE